MLYDPTALAGLALKNRFVMAPMTRSRAVTDNAPNTLMAEYYAQRAGAGLIVTEGTSPSPNGLGYPRIPGLYSDAHVAGWKLVTQAVHEKGGKIFVQLMHTGRVAAALNLPAGAEIVGPTDVVAPGKMYTDAQGEQPHGTPRAMTAADIAKAVGEHVTASEKAIAAGFDGVEIHGANGYLVEQFLNGNVNTRSDDYGGSSENRNRFAIEVVRAVAKAIGKEKVGIRISPYGVFNATGPFDGIDAQYTDLVKAFGAIGIAYVHLVDHESMGAPPVPGSLKAAVRAAFSGTFVLSGGYDPKRAEADLAEKKGDLVAFGRLFLANPDLVERSLKGAALNDADASTFYTPGPKGYTDYPTAT